MQARSRRPHGTNTTKVSISVSRDDLAVLKRRAKRNHRGNVSAVIHELAASLRREEAAASLLEMLGGDAVSDAEVRAIDVEVAAALTQRSAGR